MINNEGSSGRFSLAVCQKSILVLISRFVVVALKRILIMGLSILLCCVFHLVGLLYGSLIERFKQTGFKNRYYAFIRCGFLLMAIPFDGTYRIDSPSFTDRRLTALNLFNPVKSFIHFFYTLLCLFYVIVQISYKVIIFIFILTMISLLGLTIVCLCFFFKVRLYPVFFIFFNNLLFVLVRLHSVLEFFNNGLALRRQFLDLVEFLLNLKLGSHAAHQILVI